MNLRMLMILVRLDADVISSGIREVVVEIKLLSCLWNCRKKVKQFMQKQNSSLIA